MTGMPSFDGRRDRGETTMSSSGPKTDASAVMAYKRDGFAVLNINLSATAALVSGDVLFNIPAGFRPTGTANPVFGDVVNTTTGSAVRVHVEPNGVASVQGAVGSGVVLRGQIFIPL